MRVCVCIVMAALSRTLQFSVLSRAGLNWLTSRVARERERVCHGSADAFAAALVIIVVVVVAAATVAGGRE